MKMRSLFLSFILILSILAHPFTSSAASKNLYVHFINVGQGDSSFIHTAAGQNVLIDAGKIGAGTTVVNYLKKQHVTTLDAVIATHPDADHIGGLAQVIKSFKVKSVYAPKVSNNTLTYKNLLVTIKNKGLKIKSVTKGVSLNLKGVSAKFTGPVKTYSKSDTNDWSAVLRLVYGKKSFLFTGDAEFKSEADMIKSKETLKADVLKVGHHGAKTSTSSAFLKAVKPSYAVISVGKNSYGHPTSETLNRLKSAKVKIFRTDKQGNIIAITDGKTLSFNTKPAIDASKSTSKNSAYKLSVKLDTTRPKQYSTIHLTVKGIPSGSYKAVFHYKTTNSAYKGTIGKPLGVRISRASTSYRVKVDISAVYKGKTYKTETSFLPR